MYAYFKRLDYFSTECVYAPFAARGFARDFVKDLEVRGESEKSAVRAVCCACRPTGALMMAETRRTNRQTNLTSHPNQLPPPSPKKTKPQK